MDEKTDQKKNIDIDEDSMRYFVTFRCGVFFDQDASDETTALADEFKSDLATEMAFAIKKVQEGRRNADGSLKYAGLMATGEMKVSIELSDWIKF